VGTTERKIKLLRELRRGKVGIPVVLITANRDEIARSQMLDDGAVECLVKPFRRDTGTAPIAAIYGDRYAVPLSHLEGCVLCQQRLQSSPERPCNATSQPATILAIDGQQLLPVLGAHGFLALLLADHSGDLHQVKTAKLGNPVICRRLAC
jgi:DNA-binding response OmpR family regulator